MKYIVTRTSTIWDEDPKIKGVQKEFLPYVYNSWGTVVGREELREAYTMELDSLESLHQLIEDCKCPIVISNPDDDGSGFSLPKIEIYDDYRE